MWERSEEVWNLGIEAPEIWNQEIEAKQIWDMATPDSPPIDDVLSLNNHKARTIVVVYAYKLMTMNGWSTRVTSLCYCVASLHINHGS